MAGKPQDGVECGEVADAQVLVAAVDGAPGAGQPFQCLVAHGDVGAGGLQAGAQVGADVAVTDQEEAHERPVGAHAARKSGRGC